MSFIKLHEYDIQIPNLKEKTEILQISDTHLLVCDDKSTDEEKAWVAKRENDWAPVKAFFAKLNNEPYEKTTSMESFAQISDYIFNNRPDFLIHSGDAADKTHDAATRLLIDFLDKYNGDHIFVPGNHEDDALPGVWEEALTVKRFPGFCIAAVNNSKKTVADGVLSAFENLCKENIPIIAVMHIPLATDMNREACQGFTDGHYGAEYFVIDENTTDKNAHKFIRLVKENKNVVAVLCGHVHVNHVSQLTDHTVQICSGPSMNGNISKITIHG